MCVPRMSRSLQEALQALAVPLLEPRLLLPTLSLHRLHPGLRRVGPPHLG